MEPKQSKWLVRPGKSVWCTLNCIRSMKEEAGFFSPRTVELVNTGLEGFTSPDLTTTSYIPSPVEIHAETSPFTIYEMIRDIQCPLCGGQIKIKITQVPHIIINTKDVPANKQNELKRNLLWIHLPIALFYCALAVGCSIIGFVLTAVINNIYEWGVGGYILGGGISGSITILYLYFAWKEFWGVLLNVIFKNRYPERILFEVKGPKSIGYGSSEAFNMITNVERFYCDDEIDEIYATGRKRHNNPFWHGIEDPDKESDFTYKKFFYLDEDKDLYDATIRI